MGEGNAAEVKDRLEREREFHDARFDGEDSRHSGRFYAINKASDRFFREVIESLPPGSAFLDYGCGEGAYCGIHAAEHGHQVTAIDRRTPAPESSLTPTRNADMSQTPCSTIPATSRPVPRRAM